MAFQSVLICATPRSGTTLLCDLMATAGLGRPNSFYRRESVAYFADQWNVAPGPHFERDYLEAARVAGTAGTALFAMRVMWPSLPELMERLAGLYPGEAGDARRLSVAFGTTLYIFVTREDKVAQAVSRLKAEQSGLWHRHADGSEREQAKPFEAPVYDRARLAELIAETEAHEANWRDWFAGQGIGPLRVTYEGLAADPAGTLAGILEAVGRDPALASGIEARTARLADDESVEWVARFRREL